MQKKCNKSNLLYFSLSSYAKLCFELLLKSPFTTIRPQRFLLHITNPHPRRRLRKTNMGTDKRESLLLADVVLLLLLLGHALWPLPFTYVFVVAVMGVMAADKHTQ